MKTKIIDLIFSPDTVWVTTKKINAFKKTQQSGAKVVEKGIAILPLQDMAEEDIILTNKDNNSIDKPNEPYTVGGTTFFPVEDNQVLIDLYKNIKRIDHRPENMDIRQLNSLGEKIKFIYHNSFYSKYKGKNIANLRKMTFVLWLLCGIINTLQGQVLLYTLNYICAILQLDLVSLTQIVMSSTISAEKKKYILENIKNNSINPTVITEGCVARLYTKYDLDDFQEHISLDR
jgi:hypothetical protein